VPKLAVLFLAGLAYAANPPAVTKPPAAPAHVRPKPASNPPAPSDAEIEKIIRAKLAKSKISADKFTVRVSGGVATLEGRTEVIQHKGTATRMARSAGARQVVNRIEVSEAARMKASGNLASGRRRAQIKRSEKR
jgi:osmotically-inducible protein OsmY